MSNYPLLSGFLWKPKFYTITSNQAILTLMGCTAPSGTVAMLCAAKCCIYYFLLSVRPAMLLVAAWDLRELSASCCSWSIFVLSLQVQPFLQFLRSCTRQVSCGFPHAYGAPTFQDLQVVHVPYAVLHICPWGCPSWRTSQNAQLAFTKDWIWRLSYNE